MMNAVIGGVFIGLAAVWMMHSVGRIAGVSGIAANAMQGSLWAVLFIAGLGAGGAIGLSVTGVELSGQSISSVPLLIMGGVLVGVGTRLGSGCTSGHGVCGIARFSMRSMVATVVFLLVGMITATWMYGS